MSNFKRSFKCKNDQNKFCYACGSYIFSAPRKFTKTLKTAYHLYFKVQPENVTKSWTPGVLCNTCRTGLNMWMAGTKYENILAFSFLIRNNNFIDLRRYLSFDVPAIWRQPLCHEVDCYFCLTKVKQQGRHRNVEYADVHSFKKPTPHNPSAPYPVCPKQNQNSDESSDAKDDPLALNGSDSESEVENIPKPLTQAELNDWIRDFDLPKETSMMLASRMKDRSFVTKEVKITYYKHREHRFAQFYSKRNNICYCNNINDLFGEFGETYDPNEWRLFIDSSKLSLKAVLLHQGNEKPSIPVAHAVHMTESYETMSLLLDLINYKQHDWKICADLKVVALVTGLQQGYTKYCCFLCKWDSRARADHYKRKDWPQRVNFTIGQENVNNNSLVKSNKIILPPLHIKLGLFKNFVKALKKNGNNDAIKYLEAKFPYLSAAKIKEGIFVGPEIKKILTDPTFNLTLTADEEKAWNSFRSVVTSFLGNFKSPNYVNDVADLLTNYEKIGIHTYAFPLNFFFLIS